MVLNSKEFLDPFYCFLLISGRFMAPGGGLLSGSSRVDRCRSLLVLRIHAERGQVPRQGDRRSAQLLGDLSQLDSYGYIMGFPDGLDVQVC